MYLDGGLAGEEMSRSRNIKPKFFKNEDLAECDPLARILFAGLWCEADREGRLEDRPKRLKAEYLPYDECNVDSLLDQLKARGFIVRYAVNGARYIAVLNFLKHQQPHHKEVASEIPPPNNDLSVVEASTAKLEPSMDQACVNEIASCPTDCSLLIPDSLEEPEPKHVGTDVPTADYSAAFERFWAAWPVHENKKAAGAKWKQKRLDAHVDRIVADVIRRKAEHGKWQEGFIPHAATYLHNERWNDAIRPAARAGPTAAPGKTMSAILALEDMKRGLAESGDSNGSATLALPGT